MLKSNNKNLQLIETNLSDKDIFSKYFGEEVQVGRSYLSRLRKEREPSTGFFVTPTGKLIYNDFVTGEKTTAIKFVMRRFDLTYLGAIEKIVEDFKLTELGDIDKNYFVESVKEEVHINILAREFTDRDIEYWNRYNITVEELKFFNIYSVRSMVLRGRIINTREDELKFAFILDNYVKVYSPESQKFKWISTIPLNKPFGIDSVDTNSDTLIISKSLKDLMVLRKFFPNTIALQNESVAALSEDILDFIRKTYKNVYIFFDNDPPGIKASELFRDKFGFNILRIPVKAYDKFKVKDPSDYIETFGIDELKKLFKWMKLKVQ